jgi:hypothetical protein
MSDSPLLGMNRDALHDQLDLARLENHPARMDHRQHKAQYRRFSVMPQQGSRSRRNHKPQWRKVYQAGMSRATISGDA